MTWYMATCTDTWYMESVHYSALRYHDSALCCVPEPTAYLPVRHSRRPAVSPSALKIIAVWILNVLVPRPATMETRKRWANTAAWWIFVTLVGLGEGRPGRDPPPPLSKHVLVQARRPRLTVVFLTVPLGFLLWALPCLSIGRHLTVVFLIFNVLAQGGGV